MDCLRWFATSWSWSLGSIGPSRYSVAAERICEIVLRHRCFSLLFDNVYESWRIRCFSCSRRIYLIWRIWCRFSEAFKSTRCCGGKRSEKDISVHAHDSEKQNSSRPHSHPHPRSRLAEVKKSHLRWSLVWRRQFEHHWTEYRWYQRQYWQLAWIHFFWPILFTSQVHAQDLSQTFD